LKVLRDNEQRSKRITKIIILYHTFHNSWMREGENKGKKQFQKEDNPT